MKYRKSYTALILITHLIIPSMAQENPDQLILTYSTPDSKEIYYSGRIDFSDPQAPKLISAGAYIKIKFQGSFCKVLLTNQFNDPAYNYISIELDGKYQGRKRVSEGMHEYLLAENLGDGQHTILLCKATEAATGYLEFRGIHCAGILPLDEIPERKIEYIGNSITCGAEMDTSYYPCNSDQYHDRHNAYLAYGPSLARELNADWVLSSVSGMGLIRNWNDEGPAFPEFYDYLYLNNDTSVLWEPDSYDPQLVTLCLGTNDNSEGDGSYDRQPLDSTRFIKAYIDFVGRIRKRYPDAMICLLTSPVFDGETRERFTRYQSETVAHFQDKGDRNLYSFTFSGHYNHGCTGHPSVEDHKNMKNELLPFIKQLMNW
jgi:lysophospholipase L1-like esterase